jgi:hypothetical protein
MTRLICVLCTQSPTTLLQDVVSRTSPELSHGHNTTFLPLLHDSIHNIKANKAEIFNM